MATSILDKVRACALFHGLGDAEMATVAGFATLETRSPGNVLLSESHKGSDLFAILGGRVQIAVAMPDGKSSETLATLKEGDILGESALLGKNRRSATAVAQDEVTALRWDGKALEKLFAQHPPTGYLVMRNLARILHERLSASNMLMRNTLNRVVDID